MSLTAQIEIPASQSLFILARILALGGSIWTGITAVACFNQSIGGERVWFGLLLCALIAAIAGLWKLRSTHLEGGLKLHIQEDGRVLLIQTGTATSSATAYRVARGSIVWPGLCILRLRPDEPAEGRPGRQGKEIVFVRQGASSRANWPVARLLYWILRKGGADHDFDI